MQNYFAGLTISIFLHTGLVLSFFNFFHIELMYSLNKVNSMPAYLVYDKSKLVINENKSKIIKEEMKEKMISSPTIKISDAKVALADIEIEKILLFNQKEKIKPVGEVEQISFYSNKIRDQIMMNWKPPTSTRSGMKSELTIVLVPTGEIIEVRITLESGNEAFDRSALTAVKKVGRFEGLKMSRKLFDDHFRLFTLIFNPQD